MKRVLILASCLATAVVILIATGAVAWQCRDRQNNAVYTDGDTIRQAARISSVREILWQPPIALPEAINTISHEYEPRLSADGQTLYFVRGKAGINADIFTATRIAGTHQWNQPQPLTAINTEYDELGPELSRNGQLLLFYTNRPGGLGGYDVWAARTGSNGWQKPICLGATVNSEFNEYSPALSPDGSRLYFASNRPQPTDSIDRMTQSWPATLREDQHQRDYDLYMALVINGEAQPAAPLTALNTAHSEGTPSFSPAGDFLYFSSDRPEGHGGFDLFRSRVLGDQHLPATNVGREVNTSANEMDPSLSMDGFGLHFSSDRSTFMAEAGTLAEYNLYYTASREVFTEVEVGEPLVDLASIWWLLTPSLLWLLLGLLLLLLLLKLLKGVRSRQLSLLARCLLASLMAHLLLIILMTFWQVTTSIAEAFDRGGTKIVLTSSATGDELASQVRGQLTNVTIEAAHLETSRAETAMETSQEPQLVQLATETAQPLVHEQRTHDVQPTDATIALHDAQQQIEIPVPSAASAPIALAALPAPSQLTTQEPAIPTSAPSPAGAMQQRHDQTQPPLSAETIAVTVALSPAQVQSSDFPPPTISLLTQATVRETAIDLPASPALQTPSPPALTNFAATIALADAPDHAAQQRNEPTPNVPTTHRLSSKQRTEHDLVVNVAAAYIAPSESAMEHVEPSVAAAVPTQIAESTARHETQLPQLAAAPAVTALASVAVDLPNTQASSVSQAEPQTHLKPGAISAIVAQRSESQPPLPLARQSLVELTPVATSSITADLKVASSPSELAIADAPVVPSAESPASPPHPAALPTLTTATLAIPRGDPAFIAKASSGESIATVVPPSAANFERSHALPSPVVSMPVDSAPQDAEVSDIPADALVDASTLPKQIISDAATTMIAMTPNRSLAPSLSIPNLNVEIGIPSEVLPPVDAFVQRAEEHRRELVDRMGGSDATERAVSLALQWLAAHQSEDGRWAAKRFDAHCSECKGAAKFDTDVATTGLALLCFMGANHTHQIDGPYRDAVNRALTWLIAQQKSDGDLRNSETMYSHGIAAIALAEAYGMTNDSKLLQPVTAATQFIVTARNHRDGGWRYEPGQAGDTSVLGWQIMALYSAKRAGVHVPEEVFRMASTWLDSVSTSARPGLYAYQPGHRHSPSMTAEAMFVQQLLGQTPDQPRMRDSAEYIVRHLPRWKGDASTYYWYYATLAMFQHQGEDWERWNAALTEQLLANQRTTGAAAGSWDPVDNWSKIGGRIYQTAMCTLSLEVYYRYLPMYSAMASEANASNEPSPAPFADQIP